MKKIIAWVLLLTLCLGLFAGCKKQEEPQKEQNAPVADEATVVNGLENAIAYIKTMYKGVGEKTPKDYTRIGSVPVGTVRYDIEWTVNVGEDLIKVVKGEDGMVTIDVNEECEEDTPYELTATVREGDKSKSYTWKHLLPAKMDMTAIVDEAYNLKSGESLAFEATLTGKIVTIDSVWSDDYQNITVTIVVEGREDKPIQCYRLKGDGAKDLQVGNIITVTGILKNYNGTIEFDAGCILDAAEKGDAVEAPTDPGEILKAAYALAENTALPYPAELTGKVTAIDAPYDPSYKNISVIIVVEGYEKYPMLCYRLKGNEADKIAVGDTITVNGIIKNYKGTIEYDAGCQLVKRVSGGGVAQGPSSDANKILSDAAKLAEGEKLPYRATLTGKVVSVDNAYTDEYKNVTVTIEVNGVKIQCYRMKGELAANVRATDTITVSGIIENYFGKLEFGSGCSLDAWTMGDRVVPVEYGPLKTDTPYLLEMIIKETPDAANKALYFDGGISSSSYLYTSDKAEGGVKVYMEKVEGKGVRFFFMKEDVKTYIEIFTNDAGKQRPTLTTTASCVWTYDTEAKVYAVEVDGSKYYLGTYYNATNGKTFDTISCSSTYYITGSNAANVGKTQFVAKFVDAPTENPDTPVVPDEPTGELTVVDTPVAGTAYKFGMVQGNKDNAIFYLAGGMSGYYMATTEDGTAAIDVYLEETEGGYYLYTMEGTSKKYINMVVSGTHVNGAYAAAAQTVYTYDAESKTVIATVNGEPYWFGTRNDNTYTTVGPCATKFNGFYCQFYAAGKTETPDQPDTPVVPDEPEKPEVNYGPLTENTSYALKLNQVKAGKVLYFTGAMSGEFLATSTKTAEAAAVFVEKVEGEGVRFYFMNGNTKTYIEIYTNANSKIRPVLVTEPTTVFTFDTEANVYVVTIGEVNYYLGAYNDFETLSASDTKYVTGSNAANVGVSQFVIEYVEKTETPDEPEQPDTPVVPDEPTGELTVVDTPVAGTAYKFGMVQGNKDNAIYYLAGGMSGYYMATTEDGTAAIDVYLEETEGGYYLYTMEGASKKYINMVVSGTHVNGAYADAAQTVYTYDAESKTVIATVNGEAYWFGTRNDNTYTTVGPCATKFNGFYCQFYAAGKTETPDTPVVPDEPETPDTPVVPDEPTGELTVVDTPVAGTAYKFGMVQGNKDNAIFYLAGGMSGYYMATTEDGTAAIDVYLEETEGGYYLYTMEGTSKKYINMVVSGTHVNGAYAAAAQTVYTYDAESKTVIATVNGEPYWFGTRNDNTYTTVGPCATKFNGFYCQFYAAGKTETPDQPDTPVVPDEPEKPEVNYGPLTENTSYALKLNQVKAGKVLYFTGAMSGEFLATSTKTAEAAAVFVEKVEGEGVRFYFMNGQTKTYIEIYTNANSKIRPVLVTEPTTVFTFDTEANVYVVTIGEVNYYLGAYNDFETLSASDTKYVTGSNAANVGVSQFVLEYVLTAELPADAPETPDEPEQPAGESATYNMEDFKSDGLGGSASTTALDENVTFYISSGWMTTQARIYKNGHGIISSQKAMSSLVLNIGYKASTFDLYVSEDGETWTMYKEDIAYTVAYADVTVELPEGCKFVKLDACNQQIRMTKLVVNFASEAPAAPVEKTTSLDFSTTDARTSFSANEQIWGNGVVTVTNLKHESTQDIRDYSNPARFYASTSLEIACKGMTKIEIVCPTQKYASDYLSSMSLGANDQATIVAETEGGSTNSNHILTIVFAEPTDSLSVAKLAKQTRMRTLTVTYAE